MKIFEMINAKLIRLKGSRNILKINFLLHKIFGEKNIGNTEFYFKDKPSRKFLIQEIIDWQGYKDYLEIGCFKNELFDFIKCENKIGVDPYSGGNVRKTSDVFFKNNKKNFDCIFIDGLHKYKQVKKDILNSLDILNDKGVILVHDCLPNNVYEQAVPRCQAKWNGDVWKSIVELRTKRDIDTYTCFADQGIGIIFKRANRNLLNLNISNFSQLKFKDYFYNYKEYMNIINHNDLKDIF